MARRVLSCALAYCCVLLASSVVSGQNNTGFISASGTVFVDKDCNEFVFSGANVWQVVEAEAGVYGGTPEDVTKMFASAKDFGINVIRFFPFGILSQFTLQTAPGVYNEDNWKALDSIIEQASQAGIKVIMPFADNWTPVNGKRQYVDWAGEEDPDSFFTSDSVKSLYKDHIRAMTSHVNSLNNRAYKDEPAILAWDLINEVRSACNTSAPNASCTTAAADYIQDWIEEMSAFVKTEDPNHMLTLGEEGFYQATDPRANGTNPGDEFSVTNGQDFVRNHSPKDIDFAATHIWVDNWLTSEEYCGEKDNPSCGAEFIDNWIKAHAEDATSLNKPFVIEEFGNRAEGDAPNATVRDAVFKAVYTPYLQALDNGDPNVRGVAFWQWVYSAGLNISYSDAAYAVKTGDNTWDTIIDPSFQATTDYNEANNVAPNCVPGRLKASTSGSGASSASAGRRLLTEF